MHHQVASPLAVPHREPLARSTHRPGGPRRPGDRARPVGTGDPDRPAPDRRPQADPDVDVQIRPLSADARREHLPYLDLQRWTPGPGHHRQHRPVGDPRGHRHHTVRPGRRGHIPLDASQKLVEVHREGRPLDGLRLGPGRPGRLGGVVGALRGGRPGREVVGVGRTPVRRHRWGHGPRLQGLPRPTHRRQAGGGLGIIGVVVRMVGLERPTVGATHRLGRGGRRHPQDAVGIIVAHGASGTHRRPPCPRLEAPWPVLPAVAPPASPTSSAWGCCSWP